MGSATRKLFAPHCGAVWSEDSVSTQPIALTIFRGMTPLGVLCLRETGREYWELGAVVTHEEHRQKGLAKALVAVVQTAAQTARVQGIVGHAKGGSKGDAWNSMAHLGAKKVMGHEKWYHDLSSAHFAAAEGVDASLDSDLKPLPFVYRPHDGNTNYVDRTMEVVHAYVMLGHVTPHGYARAAPDPNRISSPVPDHADPPGPNVEGVAEEAVVEEKGDGQPERSVGSGEGSGGGRGGEGQGSNGNQAAKGKTKKTRRKRKRGEEGEGGSEATVGKRLNRFADIECRSDDSSNEDDNSSMIDDTEYDQDPVPPCIGGKSNLQAQLQGGTNSREVERGGGGGGEGGEKRGGGGRGGREGRREGGRDR